LGSPREELGELEVPDFLQNMWIKLFRWGQNMGVH
jgi:hypothetical protein